MTVPWFIGGGGAQHSSDVARLLAYAAFKGQEGIVGPADLAVTETPVPSGYIRVHKGAFAVKSRYTGKDYQMYADVYGTSNDVAVPATDSSGDRYDMVVAVVRDPFPDGSADNAPGDTVNGPYTHLEVITDIEQYIEIEPDDVTKVGDLVNYATTHVSGQLPTALGLSVVHVPVSTGTVINAYCRDIRPMIDKRSETVMLTQRGGTQTGGNWDEAGNITASYERWPQHNWRVDIPAWCTQVQVKAEWNQPFLKPTGSTGGTQDARGVVRIHVTDGETHIHTEDSAYNVNQVSSTNGYRTNILHSDQQPVPEAIRGVNAGVYMDVKGNDGSNGRLVADDLSNYVVYLIFNEEPVDPAGLSI